MRIGLALVAVLALGGCVAVPPAGPSTEQIAAYNDHLLAQTWNNTGLSGHAPEVEQGAVLTMNEWLDATFQCMSAHGIGDFSLSYSSDSGVALFGASGGSVSDDSQLAFYKCAAANSVSSIDDLLTDDQLDYIYDYYLQSLVPCMVLNGFRPTTAPTRVEFLALAGQWSPYYSVDVGLSEIQFEELEQTCGPQRPQLY